MVRLNAGGFGERACRAGVGVVAVVLLAVAVMGAATGTVAAQSVPDCSTVTYNGDGSDANPFEVSNVDQLQCMKEDLDANYRLVSDIDASGTSLWNGGDGFEPIGGDPGSGTSFTGTFDGDGHEITDLTINRQNEEFVGLFGGVGTSGTVTDVSVVDATVVGDGSMGGLVGRNEGTVSNSSASGNFTGNDENAGSLVGRNEGTVSNSSASGNVTGEGNVGGLIGSNGGNVSESLASGNVTGDGDVGGLAGNSNEGTLSNSSASGDVTGGDFVGGLVGVINEDTTVRNSSAFGDVKGNKSVGGLVGDNEGTVEKSYARGNVTGNESVGGLVGENSVGFFGSAGTVNQSYATGNVTGLIFIPDPLPDPFPDPLPDPDPTLTQNTAAAGGLVGNNSGTVSDSYWDVNTTGFTASDGGTGLTTDEMSGSDAASNMTGFDFTNTWETVTNPDDYPILAWQSQDSDVSGPLSPDNPFADSNGNPVSRGTVINRVLQWNNNRTIDGTSYNRGEIITFIVNWNMVT